MLTVGFIDTHSQTEQIFSVFMMIMSSGGFAFSINCIGNILQEMFQSENELK